ncbi:MAG TPA: DUF4143 domain-containing protein [Terriglobia bacterium]|nr:DUF4143 domain-containing protein [Terriglobia bacterium]
MDDSRRLRPFHRNLGKRLLKSPKVYVRDSGIVHALLGIADYNALSGHPVAGASWEGFVIENLIAAAPARTIPCFYRTAAGAEIDLVLEIPGRGLWAFDIKRSLSAKPEKGFYLAAGDLKADHQFPVNPGRERYPNHRRRLGWPKWPPRSRSCNCGLSSPALPSR